MTPEVTKLVETFLAPTGTHVLPHIIRVCCPEEIPQQILDRVCVTIVKHLDKVAIRQLSLTVWDMFAFPEAEEEHWWEDCLSYYPGKVVNIRARLAGIWLVVQDVAG